MSVYRLWLTEKKEELVADLCGFADAVPKRETVVKKPRRKKAVTALAYAF